MLCKLTKLFSVVSSCSVGHRNFVVVENADPYACTYIAFYKFVGQIGRTLSYDIIDFHSRTRLTRIVHRFQRCFMYVHVHVQYNVMYYYTIYNEKYFQKVSFCVITHPIGQNSRAVCKKHGNHGAGDARGAKRRALSAAGHRSRVRV